MFFILILFFEMILSLGGYFYFYVYSNLDSPLIEEDAFRILFLGESTTVGGGGIGKENAYPAQVEKILQKKYFDKKIKSYNKGISSIETTAILRNINKNMIKYKPNLVVLMVGQNDFFIKSINSSLMLNNWCSNSKLYRFIVSIRDFFRVERNYPSTDYVEGGDFRYIRIPSDGNPKKGELHYHYKPVKTLSEFISNLHLMIQTVHLYDSEIWFAGYLQPNSRAKVNPVLEDVAKEQNIVYVGNYPEVDFKTNRSLFADDGWHPSAEGHQIIAEKIAEKIIEERIIDDWQLGTSF